MEARACRSCGKIFTYITGIALCDACKKKREEQFQEAKKFINENRGATIDEVTEATGISQKLIRQWVKEERLVLSADSPIVFHCEHCGAVIRTGRFCEECKNKLGNNLDRLTSKPGSSSSGSSGKPGGSNLGMHYLR